MNRLTLSSLSAEGAGWREALAVSGSLSFLKVIFLYLSFAPFTPYLLTSFCHGVSLLYFLTFFLFFIPSYIYQIQGYLSRKLLILGTQHWENSGEEFWGHNT